MNTIPNPGSEEAERQGCCCPVYDNAHGAGILGLGERFGWWITEGCTLHTTQGTHAAPVDMAAGLHSRKSGALPISFDPILRECT